MDLACWIGKKKIVGLSLLDLKRNVRLSFLNLKKKNKNVGLSLLNLKKVFDAELRKRLHGDVLV